MIHFFDTHMWLARLPGGNWIGAGEHTSNEAIFQTATRVRVEPLSLQSIQAILECEIPEGYTIFLRTDVHKDMAGNIHRLGYIMALERGKWENPGGVALSEIPLIDGFRAELCCWNGQVEFESSNFSYQISTEMGNDLYKFFKQ